MASILSTKRQDNTVVAEVVMNSPEMLELRGNLDNIHLFSENTAEISANIATRGAKDATKYFLIPRMLRKNLHLDEKVSCQRIDHEGKTIFVYIIKKEVNK
ncbi:hypothetical protein J4457_05460 [Candidatus Woesearchaeota archaeon]|nr:hypothetical protein [Candidatus Woesearchaeota archaeon]